MSRKPTSEELLKLPEVDKAIPVGDVYSIPGAAKETSLAANTLYRAIEEKKLAGYKAKNLGTKLPLLVVLLADVIAFKATLRRNKTREAKEKRAEKERERERAESETIESGDG